MIYDVLLENLPNNLFTRAIPRYTWQLMIDEFISFYLTSSNAELAARFGVSTVTIQKWAARTGVRKDPEYKRNVQRRNATGRVMSAESRAKISAAAKGRKMSEETKAKILRTKQERGSIPKGESHYNWKGGKPWERFKDLRYLQWRTAVLERDGYVCQECGRQCKKYERGLAAHHIKEWAQYPELRFDVSNGHTLCRQCHLNLHNKNPKQKEPIPCACGCGTMIQPFDPYGRPRRFVNHHAAKGRPKPESMKILLSVQRKGRKLSPQHRAKIALGLRNSRKRIGRRHKVENQLPCITEAEEWPCDCPHEND